MGNWAVLRHCGAKDGGWELSYYGLPEGCHEYFGKMNRRLLAGGLVVVDGAGVVQRRAIVLTKRLQWWQKVRIGSPLPARA